MENPKSSLINDEFEIGLAIAIVRKNFIWLILLVILGFVTAKLTIRYSKPVYESMAVVKIDERNEIGRMMKYENIYESNIIGEVTRIKSLKLFEKSTAHLPLNVSYFTRGKVMDSESYKLSQFQVKHQVKDNVVFQVPIHVEFVSKIAAIIYYESGDTMYSQVLPINQWASTPSLELKLIVSPSRIDDLIGISNSFYFVINSKSHVINSNYKLLDVKVVDGNAKTIGIKFKGSSATKVSDLANSLAEQFLIFNVEKKKEGANQMIAFTNEKIDKVNASINHYERLLQPYRKFGDKNLGLENVQLVGELVEKLEIEKITLKKNLRGFDGFVKLLDDNASTTELYAKIISSPENKYIQSVSSNLKSLLHEKRNQNWRIKEASYEFKELDFKIELEKRDLREILVGLIEEQKNEILVLDERKNRYLSVDGDLVDDYSYDKDFLHLSRMYQINREYFTKLLSKKAEYEMVRAGFISDNEIISSAKTPTEPILPAKNTLYIYFVGGALIFGLLIMVVKYLLHNTISNAKDISKHPGIMTLGMVPSYEGVMPVSQLLVNKNPKSLMSEAFRSIRSNLQFLSSGEGPKVIAVTSTVSGEGKTFVAMNLSGIIAFSEKKVVVIDLDLRKPKIHLGFNVQNTTGMSSVLIGKSTLNDVIQNSPMNNLDFITAGPIPPNPSELILSKRMMEIIAELKLTYDVIMIDNPPVGIVTDAFPILQNADYPIYVLRAGISKKFFLNNISNLKTTEKIKNLSVILNGVEKRGSYGYGYGYDYGYGYGYGYSSGYYEDVPKKKNTALSRLLRRRK
ncbi:MAG: tyrosine-protein kinase Etk/Wzc [Saprospiraceae bacterium]|jgi:tyrosine-protein kinase Etk/Wzc